VKNAGSAVLRFAMIGVVLVVVAGGFAYLGGWLTPADLTPARFVDAFEQANGIHAGFRRNHAKGLGVSAVLGRFSLSGGMPHVADKADAVRGLGLQFSLPDGEAWRTAMINLPVFPFRTPEAFYEQLVASRRGSGIRPSMV
jgi:catalase